MKVPSIRALAPLIGMSHTALNKHLRRGKIKAEPGGGYDLNKVRAALRANGDLEQRSQAKGAAAHAERPPEPPPPEDTSYTKYNQARAVRETFKAKTEEMDLRLRLGDLVETAKVEQAWSEIISTVRNRLLLIPDKVAAQVAVRADVLECRFVIDREVRDALTELSEPPKIA